MKKALSYLLLVSYSILFFKPVLPIVFDTLAHTLWRYEHIATVHREHGTYHLHYELEQAAEKNESASDQAVRGNEVFAALHLAVPQQEYCFGIMAQCQVYHLQPAPFLTGEAPRHNFPPPRS